MRGIVPNALLPAGLLLGGAGPGHPGTYSNPVLVETHEIRSGNPAPHVGTLGIGDPSVLYCGDRYGLFPPGDTHSCDVCATGDLVRWGKGPKVFQRGEIGVAATDRPEGVFADRGSLVADGIDAHLFQDDDGSQPGSDR